MFYSKRPSKEDAWLYKRSTDDIIVFLSGEKLNPYDMESLIEANSAVNAAPIAGFRRFQSSPLVEAAIPLACSVENEELLNAIWPSPMLRAGKGTVQRGITLDLYAAEIDALYEANGETNVAADGTDYAVIRPRVTYIYCLNRGPGGLDRQQKSHAVKYLHLLAEKVKFLDAETSKLYFGLLTHAYRKLLSELTTALFFLSSISAVANYRVTTGRTNDDGIPERTSKGWHWHVPQAIGYGQSKFISEHLLDAASREANIPAVVCRLGQVAGPTTATSIRFKQEWLSRSKDMVQNPATKFLNYFEGLAREEGGDAVQLDTKNTVCVSQTLASLEPVRKDYMENWMSQWAF
ncbi:hypothetical protein DL768_000187 [Monosporascus sp. mg162]|nr:hypothetical protein DL768_000187 [Monosporascus sp. mg162]